MTDALPYRRKEIIGDCRLFLGDCRDILPTLGKVDAVVTDPPYGIGESGGEKNRYKEGRTRFEVPKHARKDWDNDRPSKDTFDAILKVSKAQIVWGGNYFADMLPPSMGWLYWDKRIGGDFSDGELAWTSRKAALRSFAMHPFVGLDGGKLRVHPTQKPVDLMKWCIEQLPSGCDTILDPFMGSGTTGVACVKLGRSFIGIEREPDYFESACERIRKAYAQPDMFIAAPAEKPKQEAMI